MPAALVVHFKLVHLAGIIEGDRLGILSADVEDDPAGRVDWRPQGKGPDLAYDGAIQVHLAR